MGKKDADTKEIAPEVKIDPRIKDPVKFNRLLFLVDQEILHQAWGCALWAFERLGHITREQRMAGDHYQRLVYRYNRSHKIDPDDHILDDRETILDSIEKAKERHQRAQELLGAGRDGIYIKRVVDGLCVREEWPCTEMDKQRARTGLGRLEIFFSEKNKRATN